MGHTKYLGWFCLTLLVAVVAVLLFWFLVFGLRVPNVLETTLVNATNADGKSGQVTVLLGINLRNSLWAGLVSIGGAVFLVTGIVRLLEALTHGVGVLARTCWSALLALIRLLREPDANNPCNHLPGNPSSDKVTRETTG